MESNIEIQKKIKLVLSESEAEWLKALVQNPIGVEDPRDEPDDNRKMRHAFWEALGGAPFRGAQ